MGNCCHIYQIDVDVYISKFSIIFCLEDDMSHPTEGMMLPDGIAMIESDHHDQRRRSDQRLYDFRSFRSGMKV